MLVDRTAVVATLRSRDLNGRADWVDRELPEFIDTAKNAALLRTLGIDVATLSPRTQAEQQADQEAELERQPH